jgi:Kef-type K+ transport system membrane component KefB
MGSRGGSVGASLLVIFAALVVAGGALLLRVRHSVRLGGVLTRLQDTTAEIRVRGAALLLVGLLALAAHLGLEIIPGAFLAGALVGLIDRDTSSHALPEQDRGDRLRLPDPGFLHQQWVRLDLSGLLDEKSALLRVPLFLLALLVVRGVPAVLSAGRIGRSHAVASGLLQATSLPFIVTASQIGVAAGLMTPVTAAVLVCAGLLSVMIFPVIALGLLRTAPRGASSIAVAGRT